MSEYVGSDTFVALQKSLRARHAEFARNPLLSNGGRVMNILDPDAYGWDNVRKAAEADKFVGLTMVDRDTTLDRLAAEFGDSADFPYWHVFTGTPDVVLPSCETVLSDGQLPAGWRVQSHTHPDNATIKASQTLNMDVGVAPAPAYYLRGLEIPGVLTCIYDEQDRMVACASGTQRYHPGSTMAGWLFAGGVSVHPDHRRKGLGAYVNAALLRDSYRALNWTAVLEQAKGDNHGSVGMIRKCGLAPTPGVVTIIVNLTGGYITR